MGGRGSSSKTGGVVVMSQDEYLGKLGLSSPISSYSIDKTRLPHGETQRQQDKRERESIRAANEYSQRRSDAIKEYEALVESGKVRKPTQIESLLKAAHGRSENEAVQAARRALKKRGYDWRSGNKI